jgi:hypothetical protein
MKMHLRAMHQQEMPLRVRHANACNGMVCKYKAYKGHAYLVKTCKRKASKVNAANDNAFKGKAYKGNTSKGNACCGNACYGKAGKGKTQNGNSCHGKLDVMVRHIMHGSRTTLLLYTAITMQIRSAFEASPAAASVESSSTTYY